MPRSSRHKSSKHSTRDAREHSDSEKESYSRDRKGKEDGGSNSSSRHLRDSRSGNKQKLDSRPVDVSTKLIGLGNAENNDEFGSVVLSTSRKRKEKADDDRWTGGDDNNEPEMLKSEMKVKEEVRVSGESKRSSRRAANYVSGFDVEEGKKSGSKAESKHHHRSERKERGDKVGGSERERKGSRCDRSERLVDIVSVSENTVSKGSRKQSDSGEVHGGKRSGGEADKLNSEKLVDIVSVSENTCSEGNKKQSGVECGGKHNFGNTDCSIQEESKNPESDRDLDRRVRRKRDGSGDLDSHHGVRDIDDKRLPSREEITKSGKYKDDVCKDERNRDRFQEDIDKDVWRQNEKQREYRSARDYTSGKFDEKHSRNDKKDLDLSYKKSMPHSSEHERESIRDRQRDRDHDRNRGRDRDRKHDERDQDQDHDRDREPDRDRDHGTDRYRRERERERRASGGVRDHDRGRDRDRNFDHENDNEYPSHVNEKGSKYEDDRGRRRSIDGYDDYHTDKLQRVKTEVDKERSLTHKPNIECITSSSQRRASPSSRAYGSDDKFRDGIKDETKHVDTLRSTTIPETVERSPKYWSGEKRAKCDDNHIGEFCERSPNTRVSPAGLKERSPSMSFDRRGFSSRNSRRRSLDVDDAERRISGSNDGRDMGVTDDRQQNLPSKKASGDEYPPSESPFYHKSKSGQAHTSSHGLGPGQSVFRTRADTPSFAGPFGEDARGPRSRYRRSVDPNVGRGPGNAWNSVPNWPSSLPNGYIPFPQGPPGPHHGGFPPMMSQFPTIYGVRPTLDINHQGIPYHLADGDRFQGHARPIGWPNMVEGSVPPHFRGWDAGNGMLRDDSLYGPGHLSQRRDMNPDIWKQNGDMNMDIISGSQKHGPTVKASTDEASMSAHGGASKPNVESSCLDDQATSFKKDVSSGQSPMKEILLTPTKGTTDKTPESSGVDDAGQLLRAYLAKLDISMDLADPELYNQCINHSIKGEAEYLEDELELEYMTEKGVLKTEITNLTVDMKNLPAAEESVYQRAMNLYKTQSSERRSYVVPELEKASVPKENIESAANGSLEQEQTLMLPSKIVPEMGDIEPPVSLTSEEVLNVRSSQNSDLAHDVGSETQMIPVCDVDKMVEETKPEFNPKNAAADKIELSIENTNQGHVISKTEADTVIDGYNIVSIDSVPEEHSDFAVSGPLNSCNDSVKVCEGLTSASNESESVVLSRIHHAPESTH